MDTSVPMMNTKSGFAYVMFSGTLYSHLSICTSPSTPSVHTLYEKPWKPSGHLAGDISPSATPEYSPMAGQKPVVSGLQYTNM